MLLAALGLILAGQARTLVEVYAAYGLGIGLGLGCAFVPSSAPCSAGSSSAVGSHPGLPLAESVSEPS